MKYHELSTVNPKRSRRLGRGIAAGQGKTAGRGTKGQKSRTGSSKKPGFAGGQTPLMQQMPKLPGFRSRRPRMATIYTGQLEALSGQNIDTTVLVEAGLLAHPYQPVKLVVQGALTKKKTVKLSAASKPAITMIESAGGSFTLTASPLRPSTSKKSKE
jgi:large subunit ribosomal protein L15